MDNHVKWALTHDFLELANLELGPGLDLFVCLVFAAVNLAARKVPLSLWMNFVSQPQANGPDSRVSTLESNSLADNVGKPETLQKRGSRKWRCPRSGLMDRMRASWRKNRNREFPAAACTSGTVSESEHLAFR
jgi:hypothetical protein